MMDNNEDGDDGSNESPGQDNSKEVDDDNGDDGENSGGGNGKDSNNDGDSGTGVPLVLPFP
jgi:hypothetical protein